VSRNIEKIRLPDAASGDGGTLRESQDGAVEINPFFDKIYR